MKTHCLSRGALVCALLFPVLALRAKVVVDAGFEEYAAGSNIGGQTIGSGSWSTQDVSVVDLAVISTTTAASGSQSLRISDEGNKRPRATLSLTSAGFVSAPLIKGSVTIKICEDPADGGSADAFTIRFGNITISRSHSDGFWYTMGVGSGSNIAFSGAGYAYIPGEWNTIRVDFDDFGKTADLFINDTKVRTLSNPSANFTVSAIELSSYSSGYTGDTIYFDNLHITASLATGFEEYAAGSDIAGQTIGSGLWSTLDVTGLDQAVISADTAASGSQSLRISDEGNKRPRAILNLTGTGFAPAPLIKGSVTLKICEDPADNGSADAFTIRFGNITISHSHSDGFWYTMGTGFVGSSVAFSGSGYAYIPGAWNTIRVDFDDFEKTADLFINGTKVRTLSDLSANFTVSTIELSSYYSGYTGDTIYFDNLQITASLATGFEEYASGSDIAGKTLGSGSWFTANMGIADQAVIDSVSPLSGTNALRISDNDNNTRPRAFFNLTDGGFIPDTATAGTLTFSIKEDDQDSGAGDSYTLELGTMKISNSSSLQRLSLSVTDGPFTLDIPYLTATYKYTPGAWNQFKIVFDDAAQYASLYINGGYAGSVNATPGSSVDFTMGKLIFGTYSSVAIGDSYMVDQLSYDDGIPPQTEWRSSLYPKNWQPGYTTSEGLSLHDFSYAGYNYRESDLPGVMVGIVVNVAQPPYNADTMGTSDATSAIQSAINAVEAAGGGEVYLPAGTYKVSPTVNSDAALRISHPNVLLRGAGSGQTFIHNTQTDMKNKSVILLQASTPTDWYAGTNSTNLTADLLSPTTIIPVASTSGFNVGDLIIIRNDLTTEFITEIGMLGQSGWRPGSNYPGRMLTFCRRIVSISASIPTTLTVDVPTRYPIKTRDNARVLKPVGAMLSNVGVQDLSIGMDETTGSLGMDDWNVPGTGGYKADRSFAIRMISVENGWIQNVQSYKPQGNVYAHLLSNGIDLTTSRLVTVGDCVMKNAQYKGGNGNGYMITLAGQECLIKECRFEGGRHDVSFGKMQTSGNVVLRCSLVESTLTSDFHQFLSISNLLDCTVCDGVMIESRFRGEVSNPTPGWTTAQSVFWNTYGIAYGPSTDGTTSRRVISSYQLNNDGYIIGTQGEAFAVSSSDFVEGVGAGSTLVPESLYEDQLSRRLNR